MNALHPKAAFWIRSGLYDGLVSFADLEGRINKLAEEKDRGDAFEIFIEGYLANQPITQRVRHWVVGNVPLPLRERYKLPSDGTGIDGIYEIHDGSHVAYQVKYRQSGRLSFSEVAPFLGITEKFADRIIFTNAATLSDKAHDRSRWVSGDTFRSLPSSAFISIEEWLKEKPVPAKRFAPDPNYQTQALTDIKATLDSHDRGTVVMACGSGKTLVALWAAEHANPRTVLVLVPSLTLMNQTLTEWSQQTSWGERFSYICVCSDPTVGLKDDDALNTDKSDLGFRIDTDPGIVRSFLQRQSDDVKIVFSTYQSSPIVGRGAAGLPPFDFAIFDEAHKTTGHSGGAFGYGLSDENIRIKKRLFLTATPRHIDIRHRDKEGEFRVNSMDDAGVYGPRAHTLSFAAAAKREIICPYKVVISLIDKEMVDDFTRKHGITIVENDEIGARWVANLIGIQRAVEAVGASKIISFHSRVRLAQEFAANNPRGLPYYLPGYDVRHVNGTQSSADRSAVIQAFRASPKAVLTNARCLTEGVDIPAVDMVAFIDPRQSRVDITQAVGRAMRKSRPPTTKTVGYVVVPLFAGMDDSDDLDATIKSEKFAAIADVLNALQEHDEELVDIIREIRERKGAGRPFGPKRLIEKVEVLGPKVDLDQLTQSIAVEICEKLGNGWDEWFGLLTKFKEREGHCRVGLTQLEGGAKLGNWVHNQRQHADEMPAGRKKRLDELGFVWDPYVSDWETGFAVLKQFKARQRHCGVPRGHIEGDYKLGQWAANQRARKDELPLERRKRLDELGFEWDPYASDWEKGFAALKKFKEREGNCRVLRGHMEGDFKLGSWIAVQRSKLDKMPSERKTRLDELGVEWDPYASDWERGFASLMQFKSREGHFRVPVRFVEGDFRLGSWVNTQRTGKELLSPDRQKRLDEVGFEWDGRAANWNIGLAALAKFRMREGHCLVPDKYIEGDYKLGQWVGMQRGSIDTILPERRKRLDEFGFEWDPLNSGWEKGFAALKIFKERERNCRVPPSHTEGDYKLGMWVARQRTRKDELLSERRQRLDELGFEWDPSVSDWEKGFAALKKFKEREGHCRVPSGHMERDFALGRWAASQRHRFDEMPPARKKRLDELSFNWDPLAAAWEEGFQALSRFKMRHGHCRVPQGYTEDGYKLGVWIAGQRSKSVKLLPDRKERLVDIGFDWDPHTTAWERGFAALVEFKSREGHCRTPLGHVEGTVSLGAWVGRQRQAAENISTERKKRLNALGFEWDPFSSDWERGFAALAKFKAREGHCRVPSSHTEGDFKLGQWVSNRRGSATKMTPVQRKRLDDIGFIWLAR